MLSPVQHASPAERSFCSLVAVTRCLRFSPGKRPWSAYRASAKHLQVTAVMYFIPNLTLDLISQRGLEVFSIALITVTFTASSRRTEARARVVETSPFGVE